MSLQEYLKALSGKTIAPFSQSNGVQIERFGLWPANEDEFHAAFYGALDKIPPGISKFLSAAENKICAKATIENKIVTLSKGPRPKPPTGYWKSLYKYTPWGDGAEVAQAYRDRRPNIFSKDSDYYLQEPDSVVNSTLHQCGLLLSHSGENVFGRYVDTLGMVNMTPLYRTEFFSAAKFFQDAYNQDLKNLKTLPTEFFVKKTKVAETRRLASSGELIQVFRDVASNNTRQGCAYNFRDYLPENTKDVYSMNHARAGAFAESFAVCVAGRDFQDGFSGTFKNSIAAVRALIDLIEIAASPEYTALRGGPLELDFTLDR